VRISFLRFKIIYHEPISQQFQWVRSKFVTIGFSKLDGVIASESLQHRMVNLKVLSWLFCFREFPCAEFC